MTTRRPPLTRTPYTTYREGQALEAACLLIRNEGEKGCTTSVPSNTFFLADIRNCLFISRQMRNKSIIIDVY